MTHADIRFLWEALNVFIKYVADNDIKNHYLNYGLKKNGIILEKEFKLIQESTSQRLIELERKAIELGNAKLSDSTERTDSTPYLLGYVELTEEEKVEHTVLAQEFNTFLQTKNDTKLYMLKFSVEEMKKLPLTWQMSNILANFVEE